MSDDIDVVCDALLTLESDLGSLEDYDTSHAKVKARKLLTEERKAAAEATQQAKDGQTGARGKKGDGDGARKRKRRGGEDSEEDGAAHSASGSGGTTQHAKRRNVDVAVSGVASSKSIERREDTGGASTVSARPSPPEVATGANATHKRLVAEAPTIDPSSYPRTVFAANLNLSVTEDVLNSIFTKCGPVEEVRLVKTITGV